MKTWKRTLFLSLLLLVAPLAHGADITVTAANVGVGGSADVTTRKFVQFGEAVTQGQAVYLKASDGKWWKADNDASAEAAGSGGIGIALTKGASANDHGYIQTDGPIQIGATVAVGTVYVVSDAAGGIRPVADQGTGDRTTILGVATSTTVITLKVFASGAQVP